MTTRTRHYTVKWAVGMTLAATMPSTAVAAPSPQTYAPETLRAAIALAGPIAAGLPIELAATPPASSPTTIEGWTTNGDDGRATQIFVYTGSEAFRCASQRPPVPYLCQVRLAAVIVHEAWHFRNGPNEPAAYDAQLAFLNLHDATAQTAVVSRSRDRALAAIRRQREDATRPR